MTITTVATNGATDTRQRLIDACVSLCARYSFAGTSLQMIANELGITKAAIYHHFRTREDLLRAVVEPVFEELRTLIDSASEQRTPNARAEAMLTGYVDIAVGNKTLFAVLAGDPGVASALRADAVWGDLIERQGALFAGVDPGPAGEVKASLLMAGIAFASGPTSADSDEDDLRKHLVEAGRRMLGLRAPSRRANRD